MRCRSTLPLALLLTFTLLFSAVPANLNAQAHPLVVYAEASYSGAWCYSDTPLTANIDSSCNDQISSIQLQPGWSVRLFRDPNQGGPSFCLSRSDATFGENTFEDGSPANDTISSFVLVNQPWCGSGPTPAYQLEVFNDPGYSGNWCYSWRAESANIFTTCDNQISALLLRAGWSIRVYRDGGQVGPSACITSSDANLADNTFEDGAPMNDAISSFSLYSQPTCPTTPYVPPTYALEVFTDPGYTGSFCYSDTPLTANIHSSCNERISAIKLRAVWSVRVYRDAYQQGPSACLSTSDPDLANNTFEDGSPMQDAISSFTLAASTECPAIGRPPTPQPQMALEVYTGSSYAGSYCYANAPTIADIHASCAGRINSIRLLSGWAVRVYKGTSQQGLSRCLTTSDATLADNTFEDGSLINGQIASFALYNTSSCAPTKPADPVGPPLPSTIRPREELREALMSGSVSLPRVIGFAEKAGNNGDVLLRDIGKDSAELMLSVLFGFIGVSDAYKDTVKEISARAAVRAALPGAISDSGKAISEISTRYGGKVLFDESLRLLLTTGNKEVLRREILQGGFKYYVREALEAGRNEVINLGTQQIAAIWSSSTELSELASLFAADARVLDQDLSTKRDRLNAGIPQMSDAEQQAYAEDLGRRAMAGWIMAETLYQRQYLVQMMTDSHESNETPPWQKFFLQFGAQTLATMTFDGPGALIVGSLNSSFDAYMANRKLSASTQAYGAAAAIIKGAPEIGRFLYLNTTTGYNQLANRIAPNTATGRIDGIRHISQGRNCGMFGWSWCETASYTELDVVNTGRSATTYLGVVRYGYDTKSLGLFLAYVPQVSESGIELAPGQRGTIRLYYKQNNLGGSPNNRGFLFTSVIGCNDTGCFSVGPSSQTLLWEPQHQVAGQAVALEVASAELVQQAPAIEEFEVENPIDVFVRGDLTQRSYIVTVSVANPTSISGTVRLTQPLLAGAELIASDLSRTGLTLSWSGSLPAGGVATLFYKFRLPEGTPVEDLPPATLTIENGLGEVVLRTASEPVALSVLPAVEVTSAAPTAVEGTPANMGVQLTNHTELTQAGMIKVELIHSDGSITWQEGEAFVLTPRQTNTIAVTLPPPQGTQALRIVLEQGGVSSTVWHDIYVSREIKVYLPAVQR